MAKLTGRDKAAILLTTVGEEIASEVLRHLDVRDVRAISSHMSHLGSISSETAGQVIAEYHQSLSSEGGFITADEGYVRKILLKALGQEKANRIMETLTSSAGEDSGFETLKWLDAKTVANFLKIEHPQTIAIILAHLDPDQASEVLSLLPAKLRGDVVLRVATLESIPPGVLKDLDEALQDELKSSGTVQSNIVGGIESVAEIMNRLEKSVESNVLSSLEATNPDLAEQIRQLMFVFDDLVNVDDRGIQMILKEVTSEELLFALKGASEPVRDQFFKNMSSRAATILKEDMEAKGPVKLSEVEKAQQNIVKAARRLEEEGKIVIGGKGGEEMVV